MFSINVRGERDPRDADMVRLTMVIYRTGYVRSDKILLYVRRSLEKFTETKGRNFSRLRFRDVTPEFLTDFHFHEKQRGTKNGNTGGADGKIKALYLVFLKAKSLGVYGADSSVFRTAKRN